MTRNNRPSSRAERRATRFQQTFAMMGFVAASAASQAHAQAVAPAHPGGPTTVTEAASGRITIGIAPADGRGVSHNQYSSFSVPPAGVDLNNARARAGMILNEVTSSRRSFLNGPLTVAGPRAHVVIVNPNGITVDGARFDNTSGVVLSAGRLRYGAGDAGPTVTSGSGDILVSGAGLSGAMSSLQLLAARMKIDGPVINDHPGPSADLGLTAGNAELVLDPAVTAGNVRRPLVREKRLLGGAAPDAVHEAVIDVTPRGLLSASRVTLAATGAGAGVRFAGKGLASVGAFTIDVSGKVSVRGATITGERAVNVRAAAIDVLNTPDARAMLYSNKGPATLLATAGDIDIRGQVIGTANADDNFDNDGNFGDDEAWPETRGAVTLSASGDIRLLGESADRLAVVFGSDGDVTLQAGGALIARSARIRSSNHVQINAARVENLTEFVDPAQAGAQIIRLRGKRNWRTLWMKRGKRLLMRQDFASLRLPDTQTAITGASVSIDADDVVNSGIILADNGSVMIRAKRLRNIATWTGGLWYAKHCNLTCWGRAGAQMQLVGGLIDATASVAIDAADSIVNERGQIRALGDIDISAPQVTTIGALQPMANMRPAGLGNLFAGQIPWFSWTRIGGEINAEQGRLTIRSAAPVRVEGGELAAGPGAGTVIPGGVRVNPAIASHGAAARRPGVFRDLSFLDLLP